jgi:hypothetical protein
MSFASKGKWKDIIEQVLTEYAAIPYSYSELSAEEVTELNLYIQLEHIMRLAKARARQMMVA